MIEVIESSTFKRWIRDLRGDRAAVARINARLRNVSFGNFGDVRAVGGGISELRVHPRAWVPSLFLAGRRHGRLALWGRQGQPATRHRTRQACGDGLEVGMKERIEEHDRRDLRIR